MSTRISQLSFRRAILPIALLLLPACASHAVNLVNPQSGATLECSGSGFGLASAWVQGHIDDCIRRSKTRGYIPIDKLTSEQRADLERRGLLHKNSGTPAPNS